MRADKYSLEKIFSSTERLEAPLFQRPYVWKEETNWEPLWEAIRTVTEKRLNRMTYRPHFMGTVVLDQMKTLLGKVHTRQLIDGQQRLTTLQIVFAAARDISMDMHLDDYADLFRKLTVNSIPKPDNQDDIFKVWPTNADRENFKLTMRFSSRKGVEDYLASVSDGLIPQAYLYFYDNLKAWINNGTKGIDEIQNRIDCLYYSLKDDLHIVVIELDDNDDAQEIFETLNALGTPLLPADLVKNYLFHLAEAQKLDTNNLYEIYWTEFDSGKSYWREETRQGRLKRARIDLFLGHFLTLKTGNEIYINQLFSDYKDYVQQGGNPSAETHLSVFREYANVYKLFDSYPIDSIEGVFFYRLDLLDTTTIYPLLLEVFKRYKEKKFDQERQAILRTLESYLVRRTICELTAKNYNRLFADMVKQLTETDGFNHSGISKFLLDQTSEVGRWPDDKEFTKAWVELKFYKRLKKTKTRMVLEALEKELFQEKTEKIILNDTLTIEHIMPREWQDHWPIVSNKPQQNMDALKNEREALIHTIGNLTLLTKKLNPSVSNSAWVKKKEAISKFSSLALNRELMQNADWNEETIKKRSQDLLKKAVNIWKHPN